MNQTREFDTSLIPIELTIKSSTNQGVFFKTNLKTLTIDQLTKICLFSLLLNCVSAPKPIPKPNLTQIVKAGDWNSTQDYLEKNPGSVDSINDSG
ncbi:hypothetical protein CLV96_1151 [Leptospira meyeri]|uniref:Uncharacterized protein n=1 Tax=Leptospira meyeri TaxID=29508 RepID=A0A4R8MYQ2_LEPME|nr:hypothetical protein [Leptospira meyeri]TDY72165.1 hypothetical protein CLV96_1151 [Leptospira meyeri]